MGWLCQKNGRLYLFQKYIKKNRNYSNEFHLLIFFSQLRFAFFFSKKQTLTLLALSPKNVGVN
jgi:hypothetical protein